METLVAQDRATIWHPWTQMEGARNPIPIIRGQGATLHAADGSTYLDGISSWWVNLHGHAHPHIVSKMHAQAQLLDHTIFADFTHPPAVELAVRLLQILPGPMDKLFYSDNGSTAVETALKMALQYWHNQGQPRRKVVCLRGSYHGDTFGAMAAAGKNRFNRPFWSHLFEAEMIDPFDPNEEIIDETTACFIYEPRILGLGGMIIYPPEMLHRLLKRCERLGVLTIADEVMTGFGRTGPLFASDRCDIICLSKGLTGGFLPLGVTACKQFVYDAFLSQDIYQALLHGHSFTANPIACATALASLDLTLHPTCEHQRQQIAAAHAQFCRPHPRLSRCESLGTILVLEYDSSGSYSHPLRHRLYDHFLSRGTLLRPLGNVLYVMPPYCITPTELQQIYQQIEETLCASF